MKRGPPAFRCILPPQQQRRNEGFQDERVAALTAFVTMGFPFDDEAQGQIPRRIDRGYLRVEDPQATFEL